MSVCTKHGNKVCLECAQKGEWTFATTEEAVEDLRVALRKCIRRRDSATVQVRELEEKLAATEAALDAIVAQENARRAMLADVASAESPPSGG